MATREASGAIQYDEVAEYTLPPLLTTTDGAAVASADAWYSHRRAEVQELVEEQMMGVSPPLQLPPSSGITVRYETVAEQPALGGAASQRDVAMIYEHAASATAATVNLLLFLPSAPAGAAGHRLICGLNFDGNHAVFPDPSIRISEELRNLSTPASAAAAGSSHCVASLLLSDEDVAAIQDPGAIGHACPIHGGETVYAGRDGRPVGFVRRGRITGGAGCPITPWTPDNEFSAWVYLENAAAVEGAELAVQTEEGHWVRAICAPPSLEEERGHSAGRWGVADAIGRGCGIATVWMGEYHRDFNSTTCTTSIQKLLAAAGVETSCGAIGLWAWGMSQILNFCEQEPAIDASKVGVTGLSRLGKACLWAGASDPRFSLVCPCCSGHSGASLSRRMIGETIASAATRYPHWFDQAGQYAKLGGREQESPIDAHMLLALVAPRAVHLTTAADDSWADPAGEFASALAASEVWRLLGSEGLSDAAMPAVGEVSRGGISYHTREGKHGTTPEDWGRMLDSADRCWGAPPSL